MANTTISPNMMLPIPVVSVDPGPDWATHIDACLTAIDGHDHSTNKGVQITPDGLNINADLPINGNNVTTVRSVRLSSQASPLALPSDVGVLYESGVDLYYNDGAGNQVRITQSGTVTGATGTITGLPSGTASASFAAGTFTWRAATGVPAVMNSGPLVIGRSVAGTKTVTLAPNAAQAADYNLTFPAAPPAANQIPISDASGNLSWTYGVLPIGSVIGTMTNLTGAYVCTATTVADASGFVKCNGQTLADATSPMNGQVIPDLNSTTFIPGSTIAGETGGANSISLITANMPAHTHGAGSYATSVGVTGGTAALTGTTTFATNTHVHGFSHNHQWLHTDITLGTGTYSWGRTTASNAATSITTSDITHLAKSSNGGIIGGNNDVNWSSLSGVQEWYTTGVLNPPSGAGGSSSDTTSPSTQATVSLTNTPASSTGSNVVTGTSGSSGSGTSFSILPKYISALYIMRVK